MAKILRIITRLNVGGPAIHAILLDSELNKNGHTDILVTGTVSDSEGDMFYLAKDKGVTPVVVSDLGREISFKKDLKAFFALYKLMRKEKPDIVHTHTAKAGTLGRLAAILAGVPVKVHTFHGHIFDGYFSPFRAKIFILIEKLLALFTDRVVVLSDSVKNDIVNRLKISSPDKSVVVPLGLELEKFLNSGPSKGNFRRKLGVSDDMLLVGIIGRLVPIKNHKVFLDAVRKIKDTDSRMKVRFVIVGDGELRFELKAYTKKLNIEEMVIFTGWVENLAEVYVDLDLVALTSLNEGTPVSLIEAMASSRAVIATDVGGIKDLITDNVNGILVRSADADDISSKLISLLKDEERRKRLGLNGRKMVMTKYTKERLVKNIGSLYDGLMVRRAGDRC